ncbi:MAG: hypothetical protein FWG10_13465 [Eubacteriaceae bacterium]|nr:hypothetical protein [Eubacteriaceae bacterium]
MRNPYNAIETLPNALVDYLCNIIGTNSSIKFVRLIPVRLGNGLAQDILLKTQGNTEFKRVFGFPPVDTRLQVMFYENIMPLLVVA